MLGNIKINQLACGNICDNLTTKQLGVVMSLLIITNWNANIIYGNCKSLSKIVSTNSKVINNALNKLVMLSIIKQHHNVIMLNPKVFIKKDNDDKETLNRIYNTFEHKGFNCDDVYINTNFKKVVNLHKHLTNIKQFRVIDWLISHMIAPSNKLKCTRKEIKDSLGITYSPVNKVFNLLKKFNLAKFYKKYIFINPVLGFLGYTRNDVKDKRQLARLSNDYYISKQDWWKHLNTNDEFTYKTNNIIAY